MARTILRDSARLSQLVKELRELVQAIDNEENVPERYASTLAGMLADSDANDLMRCWETVGRLERWSRFESRTTERYTRLLPEVAA
jgi:hypothetical protein